MKIVYISSSIIPSRWANGIQVMKMCQAFAKNGHNVTLFARKGKHTCGNDYTYYGVDECFDIKKVPWPPIKGGGGIYGWHCFRHLSRMAQPELVYGRSIYGTLAAVRLGLPCIYEAHTPPHNRIHYLMERELFGARSFRHLVVISQALKEEYKRLYSWLRDNQIIVAHDGADLLPRQDQLGPVPNWPGREGVLQVGYLGHLYPGKGAEIIVELASRLPDMDFHVIGGTEGDIRHWRSRTNCSNLFFHGFVAPRETPHYRAMCDVLLLPCQTRVTLRGGRGDISKWTSPLKMFEYMAAGKAIVCSDLPVLREVLRHEETALLCEPSDIRSWIAALKRLRDDTFLRKRLGKTAEEEFEARYTWKSRVEKIFRGVPPWNCTSWK